MFFWYHDKTIQSRCISSTFDRHVPLRYMLVVGPSNIHRQTHEQNHPGKSSEVKAMAKDLCFTERLEAFWAAGHRGLLQYHQLLWESCLSGPERCKPKKAHVIVLSASPQYSPDVFNMFQQCKYDNYIHKMLHSIFNIYIILLFLCPYAHKSPRKAQLKNKPHPKYGFSIEMYTYASHFFLGVRYSLNMIGSSPMSKFPPRHKLLRIMKG